MQKILIILILTQLTFQCNIYNLTGKYQYQKRVYRDNKTQPQYTQGLTMINDDILLESSGLYRQSSIHYIDLKEVNNFKNNKKLDPKYFGEGCDIINNKVYQLTYKERKILVYEKDNLQYVGEIKLDSKVKEGWGLSHRIKDGELQVLITDGSSQIHIADENFIVKQSIQVKYNGEYVTWLNELEYADGLLYANQYTKPFIYAIDIDTGNVIARYDFSFLVMEANRPDGCLNGIAYNKKNKSFWITGKNWPFFQEVKLL